MKDSIKNINCKKTTKTNEKTYYFISGLPRSGSTMLSAILNQNPRFYSGPSSPVTKLILLLENQLLNDELFLAYPKKNQTDRLIADIIYHYYSDVQKPVIFDKNRSWVERLHHISGYIGIEPKIICPVRNISEILASFIAMHRRNPYQINGKINFIDEMLIKNDLLLTDNNRCQYLLSNDGIIGQSYGAIKQVVIEGKQKNLHFVEYDDIINNPEETLRQLYGFLDEEYYDNHDYCNLINIHRENDALVYGFSDMHEVRKEIKKTSINPTDILSDEIIKACEGAEFWRFARY